MIPEAPFLHNLVVFDRLLRRAGLHVHAGRLADLTVALAEVDLTSRHEVYHACRTLLIHRRDDIIPFDRVFAAFWRDSARDDPRYTPMAHGPREPGRGPQLLLERDAERPEDVSEDNEHDSADAGAGLWSHLATLADRDFAEFSAEEIALARRALDRLRWSPGMRRTRRWVPGRGARVDVRRALARSLRTGGDVVVLPRERRRERPRPLVLLCDVSGSMERYSRLLLHFAHAIMRQHGRVEVFLFATELTRITPALRTRSVDAAMTAVARSVHDWSGGTRIGEALRHLHQRWSRRVLVREPVVLLVSDGWDRGDPNLVRDEVSRLQRSCHRLIWLNPLIGTVDYAPLTRALQAALPFVDDFLPVRTLSNLADLAVHLNALTRR
jgi:uncharacterized protein with von Willebrand factor type A (vWA) domain